MFRKDPPKQNVAGKVAVGAALTAAIGYIVGILTAPKSGKETRKDLAEKANETYVAAEKELKSLHTELNTALNDVSKELEDLRAKGGKKFDEVLNRGKDAKEKTRQALSNLHDGDVEDKDLQNAIKEATKAVENLRNYLKK